MTSNSRISSQVGPIKQTNMHQYRKMVSVPGPINMNTPKSTSSLQGYMPAFDFMDRDARSTVKTPNNYKPFNSDKNSLNV